MSGVPQRSVLGPLLFLTYFDTITQIPLSLGSFMDVYADDLLLYRIIHDQRYFNIINLQLDVDQKSDWVDENHLTVNAAHVEDDGHLM